MRHVLVTGAGGGLGASLCALLAALGDTVYAVDRDRAALRRLGKLPGIVPLLADVTRTAEVRQARSKVESKARRLDAVVCCAGVFAASPLVEADEKEMARILDVNLMGSFRVVREFFPLLAQCAGRVVLVGSEASRCAMPFNGPYTVSKSALQAYADVLRRELMFVGIPVSIVLPGAIRTALVSGGPAHVGSGRRTTLFRQQLDLVKRMLLREYARAMEPARVARLIVRVLGARRPRPSYRLGNNPLRVLLGRLPAAWTDRLILSFVPGKAHARVVERQGRA